MIGRHHAEANPDMADSQYGTDGAFDRVLRIGHKTKQVPAIFIHAGAGFHSHQNEQVHLDACVAYGTFFCHAVLVADLRQGGRDGHAISASRCQRNRGN